tara:strand:+ start:267 stop:1049 length:783 start_codon:yes stop_codon:yes gene_type:complete
MSVFDIALTGWAISAVVMFVAWAYQWRSGIAGIVDVLWAWGTGFMGVAFACLISAPISERQWLVAALALGWGLRLGAHLMRRLSHDGEDARYAYMRSKSGAHPQRVMFVFFQVQAAWVVLFALPMWAAATAPGELRWTDGAGVLVWIAAILGEWRADRDLLQFRSNPENAGKVCRDGWWRYSRHPNYFFEWVHWLAYCFIAAGSPYWWVTLAAVVVIYVFLSHVTGIPWTEQQSLRRRGDAYREYQATTSRFFPWPPRVS